MYSWTDANTFRSYLVKHMRMKMEVMKMNQWYTKKSVQPRLYLLEYKTTRIIIINY